jgi:hypothetical protein
MEFKAVLPPDALVGPISSDCSADSKSKIHSYVLADPRLASLTRIQKEAFVPDGWQYLL